jgi:hypothetical protein
MLNIPEKLLRALGFLKDNNEGLTPQTAQAKALLRMMQEVKKGVATDDAETEEEEEEEDDLRVLYAPRIEHSSYYNMRHELKLSAKDLRFLDDVHISKSTFNQILACHKEIIRLLAAVSNRWRSTIEQDPNWGNWYSYIDDFGGWVGRKEYNFRKGSWNYNSCIHKSKHWLFSHIFQLCENEVREQFQFGRTLSLNRPYKSVKVLERIDEIVSQISGFIKEEKGIVLQPNASLEIELNSLNVSRWKTRFAQFCEKFDENTSISEWIQQILDLYKQNKETNNNHHLFFQASQFLTDYPTHKSWAVKMYAYYGYCLSPDEKQKKWTQKQIKAVFSKEALMDFYKNKIENLAFKVKKQADFFVEIDKNIVDAFAPPKRKTIDIDLQAVAETKAAHSETVAILNEILSEESSEPQPIITPKIEKPKVEKLKVETSKKEKTTAKAAAKTPKKEQESKQESKHNFLASLGLNAAQTDLLAAFEANNLQLTMAKIRTIAQAHTVPANALIDSINETCFELLDDVLIEENEADVYEILADYHKNISI